MDLYGQHVFPLEYCPKFKQLSNGKIIDIGAVQFLFFDDNSNSGFVLLFYKEWRKVNKEDFLLIKEEKGLN